MTIKIEGLRELERSLTQFTKSTARGVLNRALKNAAKPIADQARADAPVDSGELKASIGINVTRTGSAGKAAYAGIMRGGGSKAEAAAAAKAVNSAAAGKGLTAVVSVGAAAPHAVFSEFGTRKAPAQPYLLPAMRGRGKDAVRLNLSPIWSTSFPSSASRM